MDTNRDAQIVQQVAEERYEEALGLSRDAPKPEVNRQHIRLASEHRHAPEVLKALARAKTVLLNEKLSEKGQRLSRSGAKLDALPYLEQAMNQSGQPLDYHWYGSTLGQLGRYEAALPPLRQAVQLRGEAIDHHWLGSVLLKLGQDEAALPHLNRAVELRGEDLDYESLCTVLVGLGRPDEALACLRRAGKFPDPAATLAEFVTLGGIEIFVGAQRRGEQQQAVTAEILAAFERGLGFLQRGAELGSARAGDQVKAAASVLAQARDGALYLGAETQGLLNQAQAAAGKGDYDTALDRLRKAQHAFGDSVPGFMRKNLANCLTGRAVQRANQAVQLLDQADKDRFNKAVKGEWI